MQVQPTHVFDKLLECHDQASYQRFGFAKYVLKNVKTPSKTVKIWPFCEIHQIVTIWPFGPKK